MQTLGAGAYQYPPPEFKEDQHFGLHPVDFILESILRGGLEWFRTTEGAGKRVFGHLEDPWLSKYGEAKIIEITNFIKKYEIKIVQHFALIDATYPTISIQLLDGSEMTERAGLADFRTQIDVLDADNMVKGRTEVGYAPVFDNIQIGIHNSNTPDLTKYLYYLTIYILSAFKPEMERRGLHLGTFRATDLSRMNEFLPSNIYSRFINFSIFTIASFDKGMVPIVEQIIGASYPSSSLGGEAVESSDNAIENVETGLRLSDTNQSSGG
jgi:hypothetical protein